jgi:predicted dienelactone hydrolase
VPARPQPPRSDPANLVNRQLDVRFTLDQLTRLNKEGRDLKGRLDLKRVGMAGHSIGADTTLAAVGQTFFLPGGRVVSRSRAVTNSVHLKLLSG